MDATAQDISAIQSELHPAQTYAIAKIVEHLIECWMKEFPWPASFSGNYNDLTNKPTLFSGQYSALTGKSTLFDGNYASLTNKPSLFDGSWGSLSNKPTLFSGSYADLTNRPALFDGTYASLSGKPALFSGAYADLTGKPTIPVETQRIRAQTNTSGIYTWVFPVPYAAGVIPVIECTVEDNTANTTWNHQITAKSNTQVTIQITKTSAVTVLGISVLGIQSNPQAFIHLTAIAP